MLNIFVNLCLSYPCQQAIELLPARRINAQITNIHSLSLRLQLEGARISVNDAGMALSIHVHERTAAEGVSDALRRKGFLLDVEENGQNEYGRLINR